MYNIDDYDLKILTLLQANGRLTNQELSELIGLSASQCSRRRIALEQAQLFGVILYFSIQPAHQRQQQSKKLFHSFFLHKVLFPCPE